MGALPCFVCATITLLLAPTLLCTAQTTQTNGYLYHVCGNTGNFTSNSTYETNLNQLFSSLSSNLTTTNGYQNITIGENPDRIYGAFMCRGDVTPQFCKSCVDLAMKNVTSRCPKKKESIMWFEHCMLRYSNKCFFSTMQIQPTVYAWNVQNVSDPNGFNRVLGDLMGSLVKEATNGSRALFKTKQVEVNSFANIYGLVQCTPDLSPVQCNQCLTRAVAEIPTCCSGEQGGRVIYPSCNLRFEVYPFYEEGTPEDQAKKYLYHRCGTTGNFTDSSAYATNLKQLLSSLASNVTSSSGYENITIGRGPERIYGAFMCRGNVETKLCQLCVDTAMNELTQRCPHQKESFIWYEFCLLRYSSQLFFSVVETSSPVAQFNYQNATDPEGFYQVLRDLMSNLRNEATNDANRRFPRAPFASKEKSFSGYRIFGLVQCTPDLSLSDCSYCLGVLVGKLSNAYSTGGSVILPSCYLKYDIRPFYESRAVAISYPPPLSPRLPPPSSSTRSTAAEGDSGKGQEGKIKKVIIPIAVTIGILTGTLSLCCFLHRRKFKRTKRGRRYKVTRFRSSTKTGSQNDSEVNSFSLSSILEATNCFSAANKLGEGGFGPVYQGTLLDGRDIAVKRLSKNSGQGQEEFMNEVTVIAKLQHKNLVRLLGCCNQEEEKMLVYEYMPNKSLDKHLFDSSKRANLDWNLRFHIIEGIAQGILYLHKYSRLRIIHRDLKASNILLDDSMNPKISDFGMARIFGGNQTEANTGRVVGTYGYMSPEYALNGVFSEKSDVFSFGVLLIEIISSKRNTGLYPTDQTPTLLGYAWELWNENRALELMDESIRASHVPQEVLKCIQIGLLCIQEDPTERPTMSLIVSMLGNYSSILPSPKHPGFFLKTPNVTDSGNSSNTSKWSCSINEVTISSMVPR